MVKNKTVLVVAAVEGFIVKGVEAKLKGLNLEPVFCPLKVNDIKNKSNGIEFILLFIDDNTNVSADALVYIKDYCFENDKQIMFIGSENDHQDLVKYIPDKYIYEFFKRPLDMDHFLDEVEKYTDEQNKIARKKSILIVDDDVSYMAMIMDWLKDTYRVSLVNSGMQAITWLATNHADLILLDYEMPVTTGPQVLEMIKSDPAYNSVPVMFLTGKGDKESIMKVVALKPAGYLLKTVQRNELRDTLGKFFATRNADGIV